MNTHNPHRNASGCADPTAYNAIRSADEADERAYKIIKTVKYIIRLAGFDLLDRVAIQDKKTGREYR